MSYLLDKKLKRKKYSSIFFFLIMFVFLVYFRADFFYGLSQVTNFVFRPFLVLRTNIGNKFANTFSYFSSKQTLSKELEDLKSQLAFSEARMFNYDFILSENEKLKEILDRKNPETDMILAVILGKGDQSAYDTLIIDVGTKHGVNTGDMVYALGNVPVGRVGSVYEDSSRVILFTNAGEKTQVIIKEIFFELIGRGGGNFEMILPRDIVLNKGEFAILPGITPYVVGVVETIISDPRDSFKKALLTSPVNIEELKFVEIAK